MTAGGLPNLIVTLDDGSDTFAYDITAYVDLGDGALTITRGRADELAEIQPSTLTMVLNNGDGRFTLGSTTIGTTIIVNMPIRVAYKIGATTYTRFTGYVQEWTVEWPDGTPTSNATTTVTATDRLARLSRRSLLSAVESEYLQDNPLGYYMLSEVTGSTTAANSSTTTQEPLSPIGTGTVMSFGTGTGPATEPYSAAQFAGGQYLHGAVDGISAVSSAWIECFFSIASGQQGPLVTLQRTFQGTKYFSLQIVAGKVRAYISCDSGTVDSADSANSYDDGQVHHAFAFFLAGSYGVVVYVDGVFGGGSATALTGETLTAANLSVGGYQLNTIQTSTTCSVSHVAYGIGTIPSLTRRQDHALSGSTGFAGETSDSRIERLAAYGGVPWAYMNTENGVQTVPFHDHTGVSALSEINSVAKAEGGLVFVDASGYLILQNRRHRENLSVLNHVTATSDAVRPASRMVSDTQYLTNYVLATAINGTQQTVQNNSSVATHEAYTATETDLLVNGDAEALDYANYVVGKRSTPHARFESVNADLLTLDTATQASLAGLEISDWLTITSLPTQAPASSLDLMVEGWTETLATDTWVISFTTSALSTFQSWVLDDTTYSVLDSTTSLSR